MSVAVVSGSNKGIGLAIVRALCQKFNGDIFLTSRSEERGIAAIKELEKEGIHPKFHLLDICDAQSVEKLRDFMKATYGGIDILVNNAAICFTDDLDNTLNIMELSRDAVTFGKQAKVTMNTNYWSGKVACEILFPILKPGARVVNVSSAAGFPGNLRSHNGNQDKTEEIIKTVTSEDLTVETLDNLMRNFEESAANGSHNVNGWPNIAYFVSKLGWSALSRIQQKMMNTDPREDIVVNHVHPGFIDTDMAANLDEAIRQQGPKPIDRGAEAPVFLALLPPKTDIRGAFVWHDCTLVDWVNGPLPSNV